MSGTACDSCGAQTGPTAKFCAECGAPAARVPEVESRRVVTLLFADVVGSTQLGELHDDETLRQVMGDFFELARSVVERHGGVVEKFVGDAVLAVFGVPEVREDDALRAVRAAHEITTEVARLSDRLVVEVGLDLVVRVGVNTGAVVAGAARAGGSFASGDAVNTAARLEQAAGPGEVLLGATTVDLVRDAVELGARREVVAKGKAVPVAAWPLVGVDTRPDAPGRRRRHDLPLVGRDAELEVLCRVLDRAQEGRGSVVSVVGGPGSGKTRLLAEFLPAAERRSRVLSGRCVSYGSGFAWWPVARAIEHLVGLTGDETPAVVVKAMREVLAGHHDAVVADCLATVLGVGSRPTSIDEATWALSQLVEHLAATSSVVMVLDDVHWAEASLVDLLGALTTLTARLPFVLVVAARPELADDHPGWAGREPVVAVEVGPLSGESVHELLTASLGEQIGLETAGQLHHWAGGNSLFVLEAIAHLRDAGRLRQDDAGRWSLVGSLDDAGIPASVAALLTARLARLPREEAELVARVSVVGLAFTTAEAHALHGADPLPLLERLAERDLLGWEPGEGVWQFSHVLVRDAAYGSLPKARRGDLHERLADHQAEASGPLADRQTFAAHHLACAAELARELAVESSITRDLRARAVEALLVALAHARDRGDDDAADALANRADAVRHPSPARRRDVLVELLWLHSRVSREVQEADALDRLAAETEGETDLDRMLLAAYRAHRAAYSGEGPTGEVVAAAERALGLARARGDRRRQMVVGSLLAALALDEGSIAPLRSVSDLMVGCGDAHDRRAADMYRADLLLQGPAPLSTCLAHCREALARDRNPRTAVKHWFTETYALVLMGRAGPEELDHARARLRAAGYPDDGYLVLLVADAWSALGRHDRARDTAPEGLCDASPRSGPDGAEDRAVYWLTWRVWSGVDPIDLEAQIARLQPDGLGGAPAVVRARVWALLARLQSRRGEHRAAAERAAAAARAVARIDMPAHRADVLVTVAPVFSAAGDRATAVDLLQEARDLLERKEAFVRLPELDRMIAEHS